MMQMFSAGGECVCECVCVDPESGVFEQAVDANMPCLFTLVPGLGRLSPLQLLVECYPGVCFCVYMCVFLTVKGSVSSLTY